MCGRYYIDASDPELRGFITEAELKGGVKSGEVLPSDTAAVIANSRRLVPGVFPMRWGFPLPNGKLVINARSETASQRPMFRESARLRRCLVPASCYFEWERQPGKRLRYALRPKRGGVVYLGGLYAPAEDGVPRFVILTRSAAPGIEFIHDRMPVIVPPERVGDWLSQSFSLDELLGSADTDMSYDLSGTNAGEP